MNYDEYRKAYYADPPPVPCHQISGIQGVSLFVEDYNAAIQFYRNVLGDPFYVEGMSTHGWALGSSWLTVFPSKSGNPQNQDIQIELPTPEDAEHLQQAFIACGAKGEDPVNTMMYVPMRFCSCKDPFGVEWVFFARRQIENGDPEHE